MKKFGTVFPKKILLIYFLLGSCSNPSNLDGSANSGNEVYLQLKDSILVNYMEELTLMDATAGFEESIALNGKTDEIVIFNNEGNITNSFENERDSPNAINDIFSLSFGENTDIIVGAKPSQFAIYDKEGGQKIKHKLSILFQEAHQ